MDLDARDGDAVRYAFNRMRTARDYNQKLRAETDTPYPESFGAWRCPDGPTWYVRPVGRHPVDSAHCTRCELLAVAEV